MSKLKWRPADEREATSNVAAFIEFARASGVAELTPAEIPWFQAENPVEFRSLLAMIAGLDPSADFDLQLARISSNAAMRVRASWEGVLDSFAHYFLVAELRPDDVFVWDGAPDDPALLGVMLTGARVEFSSPG